MTEIESKPNVFMTTTKRTSSLFPPLNDTSASLLHSENIQSKFKSSPSVSSFVAIEQHKQKVHFNEKQQMLDIEEKISKNSVAIPFAIKKNNSTLGNYESIKTILLNLSTATKASNSNADQIDEWNAPNIIEKRKTYQKYFTNTGSGASSQKSTSPTSTASVTPLELLTATNRINNSSKTPASMEIIGKRSLPSVTKSTNSLSNIEDTISPHHFSDWQLHLLYYKLRKGHYLTPTDLNRLFYNIENPPAIEPSDQVFDTCVPITNKNTSTSNANSNTDTNIDADTNTNFKTNHASSAPILKSLYYTNFKNTGLEINIVGKAFFI